MSRDLAEQAASLETREALREMSVHWDTLAALLERMRVKGEPRDPA